MSISVNKTSLATAAVGIGAGLTAVVTKNQIDKLSKRVKTLEETAGDRNIGENIEDLNATVRSLLRRVDQLETLLEENGIAIRPQRTIARNDTYSNKPAVAQEKDREIPGPILQRQEPQRGYLIEKSEAELESEIETQIF
jgi:hypothetical protein